MWENKNKNLSLLNIYTFLKMINIYDSCATTPDTMLLSEVSSLEKEFLVTLYPSSLSFVKYLKILRVAR